MRIKKLLALFLSMSFIVCSLPALVLADEIDDAGAADEPGVEDVSGSGSDPDVVAGAPADVGQGDPGSGEDKVDSADVSGAPVVGGQNDNDGDSGDPVYFGICGDGIDWTYDPESHILSINGNGRMIDYTETQEAPWFNFRDYITSVSISSGVENIGNRAFVSCINLISITIPDSVTSIGDYAFDGCRNLKSVSLPNSVISIGAMAFCLCESLTYITIPSSVMFIDHHAFVASGLKEITIPDSIVEIGGPLFDGCSNLTRIDSLVQPTKFDNKIFDGIKETTLVYVPHKYFESYCSWFKKLGDRIVDIETGIHSGGSTTTTTPTDNPITGAPIDETLVDSGFCGSGVSWAFYNNGELRITGSGNMSDYSEYDAPWSAYIYYIYSVHIGKNVKSIGTYAFSNCLKIRTITIPDNVKVVGEYAFKDSTDLTEINCYSDPDAFSDLAFDEIHSNTIVHVKLKHLTKYSKKFEKSEVSFKGDLSYVDVIGNSVVLKEQIGINYYLDISDDIKVSDLSVEFKWGSGSYAKTATGIISPTSSYGANYVTTCSIAARCMTDKVKISITSGDTEVCANDFKIVDYADNLAELYPADNKDTSDYIGLLYNQKLHTLLRAMLDYGAESQLYFNYRTKDLANASKYTKNLVKVGSVNSSAKSAYSNYDAAAVSFIAAKNTIANIGDDNIGIAYDGSAVACKSNMSVKIYFTKTEGFDLSNLSASYKGRALVFKESGDSVYLEIEGMSPKAYAPIGSDLYDCGITININGKDYTYTYLDYVYKCVDTNNEFKDTAVALAVYSYFASNL